MFEWLFGKPKQQGLPPGRDVILVLKMSGDGNLEARWKIPFNLNRKEALDILLLFRGLGHGELDQLLFSQLSAAAFATGQQPMAVYLADTLEDMDDADKVIAPDKVFADGEDHS